MGYLDVLDPVTGEVLYPAEAFFYGGKASVDLPSNTPGYTERPGNPETQAGINVAYTFPMGLGFTFGATYFSEAWVDRARTVSIPEGTMFNAGLTWENELWNMRVNGFNVTDERVFRAGGSNAGLMSILPGQRWEFTAKRAFE